MDFTSAKEGTQYKCKILHRLSVQRPGKQLWLTFTKLSHLMNKLCRIERRNMLSVAPAEALDWERCADVALQGGGCFCAIQLLNMLSNKVYNYYTVHIDVIPKEYLQLACTNRGVNSLPIHTEYLCILKNEPDKSFTESKKGINAFHFFKRLTPFWLSTCKNDHDPESCCAKAPLSTDHPVTSDDPSTIGNYHALVWRCMEGRLIEFWGGEYENIFKSLLPLPCGLARHASST